MKNPTFEVLLHKDVYRTMVEQTGGMQMSWPDLVKFRHFGKILRIFGNFLMVYLVLDNIKDPLGQIFTVLSGQILKT